MDEDNDYGDNHFDGGEDYLDEDDNLDDGPTFNWIYLFIFYFFISNKWFYRINFEKYWTFQNWSMTLIRMNNTKLPFGLKLVATTSDHTNRIERQFERRYW